VTLFHPLALVMEDHAVSQQPTDKIFACRGLLGPAWRDRLIRNASAWLQSVPDDRLLSNLRAYRELIGLDESGAQRAARRFPAIAAAERLNSESAIVDKCKLMAVGGLPHAEMQKLLGIGADVIVVWEGLFFDIRDLRNACGWLSARVIEPEKAAGKYALAAQLKLVAAGGELAVRALLDTDADTLVGAGSGLFDRRIQFTAKVAQALEMPLTQEASRMRLLKTHVELQIAQQRLDFQTRKFEEKCRAATRTHELKKERLEQCRQREVRRAEEVARRREQRAARVAAKAQQRDRRVQQQQQVRATRHAAMLERAKCSPLTKLKWKTSPSSRQQRVPANVAVDPPAPRTIPFATKAGSSRQPIGSLRTRRKETA
jgi:hypothetical protein